MRNTITGIVVLIIAIAAIMAFTSGDKESEMMEGEMMKEAVTVSGTYTLQADDSEVTWTGRKKILATYVDTGTIAITTGALVLEDGLVTAAEDFVVDMNSIAALTTGSGNGQTNLVKHLKSDDFFDVENYSEAVLSFEGLESVGTTTYKATAMLTIKDVTKRVLFPFEVFASEEEGAIVAEASIDIDRTKWDITFGSDGFFDNLGENVIDDIFTLDLKLVFEEGEHEMMEGDDKDSDGEKMEGDDDEKMEGDDEDSEEEE